MNRGEDVIKGSTALVGGGAGGIGRAAAERLARDGLDVVLVGRTEETLRAAADDLQRVTGATVRHVVADLADPEAAAGAVAAAEAELGELGVVVLNAGGPRPGRVLDVDDDAWRHGAELL